MIISRDQIDELDLYSASVLRQYSTSNDVLPLGHVILTRANQLLFLLLNANLIVIGLTLQVIEPEASTLTFT